MLLPRVCLFCLPSVRLKETIDLFSLYVLFSHFRPRDATRGNSFFQMSSYARANVRITQGVKLTFFPGSHLAPKYFKVVANSKKLVAMTNTHNHFYLITVLDRLNC